MAVKPVSRYYFLMTCKNHDSLRVGQAARPESYLLPFILSPG
jgi:hypothetical protein